MNLPPIETTPQPGSENPGMAAPAPQQTNSQSKLVVTGLLVSLLVFLLVGGAYRLGQMNSQPTTKVMPIAYDQTNEPANPEQPGLNPQSDIVTGDSALPGWQRYESLSHLLSFLYPNSMTINTDTSQLGAATVLSLAEEKSIRPESDAPSNNLYIRFEKMAEGQTLAAFVDQRAALLSVQHQEMQGNPPPNAKQTTKQIGGRTAYILSGYSWYTNNYLYIDHPVIPGVVYEFSWVSTSPDFPRTVDNILSTLRFAGDQASYNLPYPMPLNENIIPVTEHGFQIEYPKDWISSEPLAYTNGPAWRLYPKGMTLRGEGQTSPGVTVEVNTKETDSVIAQRWHSTFSTNLQETYFWWDGGTVYNITGAMGPGIGQGLRGGALVWAVPGRPVIVVSYFVHEVTDYQPFALSILKSLRWTRPI
jgi:hypothetical protein